MFSFRGKVKITAETTTVIDAERMGLFYAEISDGSVNVTAEIVSQDNDSGTYGILGDTNFTGGTITVKSFEI